jgi:hypothetical protein
MESKPSDRYNIASRCADLLGSIDPAIESTKQIQQDANLPPTDNEVKRLTDMLEALRSSLQSMYTAATGREVPPIIVKSGGPPPPKDVQSPTSISAPPEMGGGRAAVGGDNVELEQNIPASVPEGIGRAASDTLCELSVEVLDLLQRSPKRFGDEPLGEDSSRGALVATKAFVSIRGRLERSCANLDHATTEVRLYVPPDSFKLRVTVDRKLQA